MREIILENLSNKIDKSVVESLLDTFNKLVTAYRTGDLETCLTAAGQFVDHTLRAVEFIRTGNAPAEIKSVAATVREIEKDTRLRESVRQLIPHIAHGMIYDIRSKRGALHVKEIDPRTIDGSLCVHGASWILAEFLRLYHVDTESQVMQAMATLMRVQIPLVETIGNEDVVTEVTPPGIELLLHLAKAAPSGLNRRDLGQRAKCSPSAVTRTIQRLSDDRYIHKTKAQAFHITGPGERYLTDELARLGHWTGTAARPV
jgi:hypothetical protein